jgi:hypothetical protein
MSPRTAYPSDCPFRDRVRDRAAELASAAGVTIEHIAKKHLRKEDVVAKILAVRGDHPGLVHIISAMEACNTYKPYLSLVAARHARKLAAVSPHAAPMVQLSGGLYPVDNARAFPHQAVSRQIARRCSNRRYGIAAVAVKQKCRYSTPSHSARR